MEGQVDVYLFLFVGMLTLALLAGAVVIFFFFYQKKMLHQQLQLSEIETAHREELLHSNIEQVESERHRIATDLHDELGGIFSTLKLKINHLNREENIERLLAESREIIDAGIASVRRISHSITPPGLEMFGLEDALMNLCQKTDSPQLKVDFICTAGFPRLEGKAELGLYRIAQELLNNAIRHAAASKITLHLSCSEGDICFEYSDDGQGFDPAILQTRKGLGLKNIEARVNHLNAGITWLTQPGKGLKTIVKVPYEG
ncbi:MAG: sensor histidine kinase [Phycisphaerae bacterium]|nr:sensor histidine kinase [Saprospiraceae bacterium]